MSASQKPRRAPAERVGASETDVVGFVVGRATGETHQLDSVQNSDAGLSLC